MRLVWTRYLQKHSAGSNMPGWSGAETQYRKASVRKHTERKRGLTQNEPSRLFVCWDFAIPDGSPQDVIEHRMMLVTWGGSSAWQPCMSLASTALHLPPCIYRLASTTLHLPLASTALHLLPCIYRLASTALHHESFTPTGVNNSCSDTHSVHHWEYSHPTWQAQPMLLMGPATNLQHYYTIIILFSTLGGKNYKF